MNHNDLAEVLRIARPAGRGAITTKRYVCWSLWRRPPPPSVYRQEEARAYNNYGIYLGEIGDCQGPAEAQEEIRRGYWSLKRSGAGVSVRVVLPGRPVAHSYINRGELLGDIDAALQDLGEAVRRLENLKVKYPSRHDYRYRLGVAYHDQGENLSDQGRLADARIAQAAAVALLGPLADDYPLHPLYRQELATSHNSLGTVEARDKHEDDARKAWQRRLVDLGKAD